MRMYNHNSNLAGEVNTYACRVLWQGGIEWSSIIFSMNAFCYPSHLTYHNLGVTRIRCGCIIPVGHSRFISFRINLHRARYFLNKANSKKGNQRNTLCALADCAYEMQEYDKAYAYYKEASDIAGEDHYIQWKKSELLFLMKRYTDAYNELDILRKVLKDSIYLALCCVTQGYCLLKEASCAHLNKCFIDNVINALINDSAENSNSDILWELYIDAITLFYVSGDFDNVLLCYIKIGMPEALCSEEMKMVMNAYKSAGDEVKKKIDNLGFKFDSGSEIVNDQELQIQISRFTPVNRWVENLLICSE